MSTDITTPENLPGACPNCRAPLGPTAVVCIQCGFDRRLGCRLVPVRGTERIQPIDCLVGLIVAILLVVVGLGAGYATFIFALFADASFTRIYSPEERVWNWMGVAVLTVGALLCFVGAVMAVRWGFRRRET
jgi:hypothetical protein